MEKIKTLKDIEMKGSTMSIAWNYETIREEAIKLIKFIRSMNYGQKLCLNCMKIYGGGNNGSQYCCRGKDGELHFIEEQTGSSIGAVDILMKVNNITEKDLK